MTSRGPFQPQPFCDSAVLYRITSPSCASVAFSWPGYFTLEAPAALSGAAECILNVSPSEFRSRVYAGRSKVQTEVCLHPGESE